MLHEDGGRYDLARKEFRDAIKLNPRHVMLKQIYANFEEKQKGIRKSEEWWDEVKDEILKPFKIKDLSE